MLAVTMLMADDRFHAGLFDQVANCEQLRARQRDGLLERDQLRARIHSRLDHGRAEIRQRAKAEHVRLELHGERGGVQTFFGIAELGRSVIETFLINVADADDFEFWIGIESGGVMHAALAHADDENSVGFAHGMLQ